MNELISYMSKAIISTKESSLIIGEAMKSILKRIDNGGK